MAARGRNETSEQAGTQTDEAAAARRKTVAKHTARKKTPKKASVKTRQSEASVEDFLDGVEDERRRADAYQVLALMKKVTKEEPKMWGSSIVGFGSYHYKYDSGREGDWMAVGFSPRKSALTLYIMSGFDEHDELMARLGKYKIGKSCLYVKRLEDVDQNVLEKLIRSSVRYIEEKYPSS